jgi:competence protein ComEC
MGKYRFISFAMLPLLVLGILLEYHFQPISFITYSFLILGLLLFLIGKTIKQFGAGFTLGFIFFFISLGAFVQHQNNPEFQKQHFTHFTKNSPQKWEITIKEVLRSNAFNDRYLGRVYTIDDKPVQGTVLLSIAKQDNAQIAKTGDMVICLGIAQKINAPKNPHQFDYQKYMKNLGVLNQIHLKKNTYLIQEKKSGSWSYKMQYLRNLLNTALHKTEMEQEAYAIAAGLLLGQRSQISKDLLKDYQNAGAVHLLAVSGLHVGIILIILQYVLTPLKRLKYGHIILFWILLTALWSYALLVGMTPSVVRAVTMFSFIAYALQLKRPVNMYNVLALSMFFILLFNPNFLFQVGFQLSYAAVFGIFWLYPKIEHLLKPKYFLFKKIWQLFSVGLSAQLMVLPLGLFYFHQFSGLFFVTNILIIPFMGFLLALGFSVTVLSLLENIPDFLLWILENTIILMNHLVRWTAHQKTFIIDNVQFDLFQLVVSYVLLISMILFLSQRKIRSLVIVLVSILALQTHSIIQHMSTQKKEEVLLLEQTGNTILWHQKGKQIQAHTYDTIKAKAIVNGIARAEKIDKVIYKPLKNIYTLHNQKLIVIDSSGIYPTLKHCRILLTQSPKINVDRLLDSLQPSEIIADGSNYKHFIVKWRSSCQAKKIPFYYTNDEGYLKLN